MNCIWLLLILFCCGSNNNCGYNRYNNNGCGNCRRNTCGCNNDYDYCNNDCDDCNNDCGYSGNTRESIREAVRDVICDNVHGRDDKDCNCRKTYNFPSYPVLNDCD